MSRERLTARVEGRVQGVGFRYWTLRHARRLMLTGWVRNGGDGHSVELVAEGDAERLDELEALLRRGAPGSVVEHHSFRRESATGEYPAFEVARTPDA